MIMQITFYDSSGQIIYFRDDMESGTWREHEFGVNMVFPFDAEKPIARGMRLSFPAPSTGDIQFFEIRNVQNIEPDAYQQITAEHIAVSELSDEHINAVEISEKTPLEALTTVLAGTLWQPGNMGVNTAQNADFSRGSVWQTLAVISSNWNCHTIPRVTVENGVITGRYIDVVPAEGTFRGLRLSIRRNMSDSAVTYDDTNVATALYGYGGSVNVPQSGGQPDERQELTFAGVTWTATAEHPAKPAGQTYIEDPAKTAIYGRNGRPRWGYYQNSDIKDAEVLLSKTWEALKATSEPEISITGTVSDLYRLGYDDVPVRLWDKAIVEVIDTGETFVKQIIQNDVDLCDPTATVPVIGDYIPNIIYINRETNERASGGGGGGARGQTNTQHKDGELFAEFRQTSQMVGMVVGTYNGGYKIDAGRIALAINEEGSEAYIEANHVKVNGETVLTTALEEIRSEVWATDSSAHSAIIQTASAIRAEVSAGNSALYSEIEQTASQIRATIPDVDNNLKSEIRQTASAIYLQVGKKAQVFHQYPDPVLTEEVSEGDFWVMDSGIRTYGEADADTWGNLAAYTWGDFFGAIIKVRDGDEWVPVGGDQLAEITNGRVEVTEEYIRLWKESGIDFAGLSIEQDRISSRVASVEQGLVSVIEQTASMIRTAVFTANSEMYSEILQTQSMIRSEVANTESNLSSVIQQTASSIQINVNRKSSVYFQMGDPRNNTPAPTLQANDVWIQSNKLNSYGEAGLHTWGDLGQYTWLDYYGSKMWAWDGTQWKPISDDQKANYDYTLLQQTQTELNSVKGDLSGAYSQIRQTKSEIQSTVNDRVNGLRSEITQTASEIRLEVTNKTNSLSSLISQTASEIRTEVNNKTASLQSQITQQADSISLVVQGTGSNAAIKAAQIDAAINNGGSSKIIYGDHITLDAARTLKLADAIGVSGSGVLLKRTMFCQANISIEDGNAIGFADTMLFLDGSSLATTIKSASVSGTTLTLTNFAGSTINFSKATALEWSWGGSVLSIAAKQGGTTVASRTLGFGSSYGTNDIDLGVDQNGSIAHSSGATAIIPIKVFQQQGGGASTNRYTKSLLVNMSSLLQSASFTSSGTKTPGSEYIGFSSVSISLPKSALTGTKTKQTSEPTSYDNIMANITSNGWYTITVSAWGVSRVYKFKVDV